MLEIALLISAFSMSAKWKPIRWHMFMASVHCSRTLKNMKQDLPNHPAQLTPKNTEDITKHILVYICVYGHPCIWCEMNQLYQMPFTQSFIHYANNTAFKMRMHKKHSCALWSAKTTRGTQYPWITPHCNGSNLSKETLWAFVCSRLVLSVVGCFCLQ